MATLLVENIGALAQVWPEGSPVTLTGEELKQVPLLSDAWLLCENGKIHGFGAMAGPRPERADQVLDARGGWVFPSWIDAHTHLVFAAPREQEWVDRLQGLSYEAIWARGGGILNSAARLRTMTEQQLYDLAFQRLNELINMGTGAVEIKSGYGLNVAGEIKMLQVIRRLKAIAPIPVRATFLGAHAVPPEFKDRPDAYITHVCEEMLPMVAGEGLADYVDVFCEAKAFTVAQMERVLHAAAHYGLRGRVHVNQFNVLGGIPAAVAQHCISVDHLEVVDDSDIAALQHSSTVAMLLPTAPFFLGDHYPPARKLIDSGVTVGLSSDFNPGTSPSGNMNFVVSLACIAMKMLPQEAINAATVNNAFTLGLEGKSGVITPRATANFFITHPLPSLAYLPYHFGGPVIQRVVLNGVL